jgi:hypothetical protein
VLGDAIGRLLLPDTADLKKKFDPGATAQAPQLVVCASRNVAWLELQIPRRSLLGGVDSAVGSAAARLYEGGPVVKLLCQIPDTSADNIAG